MTMSYQEDRNIDRRIDPDPALDPRLNPNSDLNRGNRTSGVGWLIGGLIALALIVGFFAMTNREDIFTASNDTANKPVPTVTTPAPVTPAPSTTGSVPA